MSGVRGKSGRKPIPVAIHQLRGSYRPCRHDGRAEAAFPTGTPEAPGWLKGQPRILWDEIVPILHAAGIVTPADKTALVVLCLAWGRFLAAEASIARDGLTVATPEGGVKTNPAVTIGNIAWGQVTKGLAMFGLSPVDRANIKAVPHEPDSVESILAEYRHLFPQPKSAKKRA